MLPTLSLWTLSWLPLAAAWTGPSPEYWRNQSEAALKLRMDGRLEEAESLYRRTLAGFAASVGVAHADYAVALNNLGRVRALRGDRREARRLHCEALRRLEQAVGREHPLVGKAAANLADLLMQDRDALDQAARLLERASALESDAAARAGHLERLAWLEFKRKRLARAIDAQERAVESRKPGDPGAAAAAKVDLAALYFHARRYEEAAAGFAEATPRLEAHWGESHTRVSQALAVWRETLLRMEDFTGAARLEAKATQARVRAALRSKFSK